MRLHDFFETKVRLDPKCWTGYKIGDPKTKMKGGVRVNNCVPAESVEEGREFGSYYYEQLAQKVFDRDPNLTDENKILDLGYSITKDELGSRARGIFSDRDFAGDLISAYNWLKKQGVAEGRFDEPLTGWHIVYRKSGNPVHATPSFETKDQAQKYLMTKMFANHQDYKVVHTAGVGVAEGEMDEAKYHGKEVPLGKKLPGDVKKSKVYVRKPNGKIVKVNFGDKNMRIKKSNPARRKSFRARHNCKNPGPRWKARYWSCRSW